MLNLSNIKQQMLTLIVLQSVVLTGLTALPSYAHKAKADKVSARQAEDRQKLALMEGNVTVQQAPAANDERSEIKPPMSLKQVEKYNFDFGTGFASGSI